MQFDPDELKPIIDLAEHGGRATAAVIGAIARVKELLQTTETRSNAKLEMALADLASQVADAKVANANLKIQLSALQLELREKQAVEDKLSRYMLVKAPGGARVYTLRDEFKDSQPDHFACPACLENGKLSILQPVQQGDRCFVCEKTYQTRTAQPPAAVARIDFLD